MNFRVVLAAAFCLTATPRFSFADRNGCKFDGVSGVVVSSPAARLVARLVEPPRTRVILSIDDNSGNHHEVVWDPAVNDGLQHTVLLKGTTAGAEPRGWRFSPSIEDERIQSGQVVLVLSTVFTAKPTDPKTETHGLTLHGDRKALLANSTMNSLGKAAEAPGNPEILLTCEDGQVEMQSLRLDSRRVAAAVAARGLLDQTVPAPVTEALSILAEIAVERAKSGAMELVKSRFVEPMCTNLTLETLGLPGTERAFPRSCSLLQQLRLEDVLSSGRSLVAAAKDDIRSTIAPALLSTVIVNDATRGLARIALDFANRMIDGESHTVVDLDLLVALLDHLPWSTGFERSEPIVLDWLKTLTLDDDATKNLVRAALDRALSEQFWNDPRSPLIGVVACKRQYRDLASWTTKGTDTFPDGYYIVPDRGECIDALLRIIFNGKEVRGAIKDAIKAGYLEIEDLALAMSSRSPISLAQHLVAAYTTGKGTSLDKNKLLALLPASAEPMLANGCAIRLVVGIAKWCSGRENCAAGDLTEGLFNPSKLFKPATTLPESLCWFGKEGEEKYRLPASAPKFIELASRLVAFLKPPAKGEERARALAMVRWLFAVVRTVNQEPLVDRFEEIVSHLLEPDYLRALTAAFTLANEVCASERCRDLPQVRKALELVGAVASYAQTYEQTKTLTSEEAKKARKTALESLINAATDRAGREGKTVYSIGSPVGFSAGLRWAAGKDPDYGSEHGAYDSTGGFQWRLPVAFARQRLPSKDGFLGTHLAFWLADLGQFARSQASDADDITWKDFLGLGVQAGFLVGNSSHSIVIAAEASWSPGGFTRDITIRTPMETRVESVSGSITLGLTFAYYVPFFDLN